MPHLLLMQLIIPPNKLVWNDHVFKMHCIYFPNDSIQLMQINNYIQEKFIYNKFDIKIINGVSFVYIGNTNLNYDLVLNGYANIDIIDCYSFPIFILAYIYAKKFSCGIWYNQNNWLVPYVVGNTQTRKIYRPFNNGEKIPIKYRIYFKNLNEALKHGYHIGR